MGFWVTTQNIQRLISKLGWKFGTARIDKIRTKPKRLARFDPANNRNLRNVARLMRIWPGGPNQSATLDARKWYGFLMWLHTQTNAATGNNVADDIRSTIFAGLNDTNCTSISFVAIEGTDVRVTSSQVPLSPPPQHYLVITLQTVAHGNDPKPDPGPTDGNDSEDPASEDFALGSITKTAAKKKKTGPKKKKRAKKRYSRK
jgi:hypothetical protein